MSQLKFWNKQNNNNSNNSKDKEDKDDTKNSGANTEDKKNKKNWLHAPDALVNGHVVYLVKFFGNLPVEQAKGIEVVKDAIRKLQFAQQMKKAETGTQEKFKKVEITISVDGVAVQEPRTQRILHQFPLHNISYCADEKGVKKFFSFIAKNVKPISNGTDSNSNSINSTNDNNEETHECFVFISNKLASDITLTIGQAFDLAYRKYISTAEKSDLSKAQQQLIDQEKTITIYKNRLRELSLKLPKSELDSLLNKMGILDILDLPAFAPQTPTTDSPLTNGKINNDDKLLIDTKSTSSSSTNSFVPIVPPRTNLPSQILHKSSNNSQKMEELLLNSDSDSDFDPRADESLDGNKITNNNGDIFGFESNKSFGHHLFNNNNNEKLQNNNIINGNYNSKLNSSHGTGNSFINELTPPLLAPPPKISTSRRSTSNSFSSNGALTPATPATDLFGSDPFEINANTSIFKQNKLSSISVDDFSLESLDPLKK